MGILNQPHFPSRKVSQMIADKRLDSSVKAEICKQGVEILDIPPFERLCPSITGHPDMQLVHIMKDVMVCHPHLPLSVKEGLKNRGFILFQGKTPLERYYPGDIAYNVAIIGKRAFHNTKHTDPVLVELMEKHSIRLIHVNQGYAGCSVLPVTPESLITADPSISEAAEKEGMDVLKIPPQKRIRLPGLDYGFIGGTAGFINKNQLAFIGNINMLDSCEEIKLFLKKKGVGWLNTSHSVVYDYGGLMPIYEVG